jgi:hypothetical protein
LARSIIAVRGLPAALFCHVGCLVSTVNELKGPDPYKNRLLRRRNMQISAMTLFILTTLVVQASPLGISTETPRPDRSIVKTVRIPAM